MQFGYENLIRVVGTVTRQDLIACQERLTLAGDTRDVLSARDSVMGLLGIRLVES